MNLNPEQHQAVFHKDGPLLILAGAGSGKTRVLTHRIAHLILDEKVHPERILAMTFTNKAANEMKKRVELITGISPSALWISTFHSFCLRILRKYAVRLGYRENFAVFDEGDQLALIKACLREFNVSEDSMSPSAVLARISRAKDDGISCAEFEEKASDFWNQRLSKIYGFYQAELFRQNGMDFGDLLQNVLTLFEKHPDILNLFQERFLHVLVDEYQDTNRVQYGLIEKIAGRRRNIFVVGDEDQSIYRWRGEDIRNILEFTKDFSDSEVIRLEQNYRSTPTILAAAASVIKNNSSRLGKNLWSDLPDGEKVKIVQKYDGAGEAGFVADEILAQVRTGLRYDDTAVFYRTNAQSRVFEECFRNAGIPYVIYGGMKFYERMEIKDIIAYLQVCMDENNDTAFFRIINTPPRGIGKTTLEKIRAYAREKGLSAAAAARVMCSSTLLRAGAAGRLKEFIGFIDRAKQEMNGMRLGKLTQFLAEGSGYMEHLTASSRFGSGERLENVGEFIRAAGGFDGVARDTLPLFLDQIALVSDVDKFDDKKGAVPLMTLHLSKGLEFSSVFIVGMEDGLFPHSRSLDDECELEEERRLCYVGMTRAMKNLWLTHCTSRMLYGRGQYGLPSRFLDEIDEEFVERESFYSTQGSRHDPAAFAPTPLKAEIPGNYYDQRSPEEAGFCVGTKVRHPVFGEGIIRAVAGSSENQKVTVQFKSGQIKVLVVKYAKLEIV